MKAGTGIGIRHFSGGKFMKALVLNDIADIKLCEEKCS